MSTPNQVLTSLLLLVGICGTACAHSLHVVRGEVRLDDRALTIICRVPLERLPHLVQRVAPGSDLAEGSRAYLNRLGNGLEVYAATGVRAPQHDAFRTNTETDVEFVFRYPPATTMTVLRYRPGGSAGIREQLALRVHCHIRQRDHELRLTSAGNPAYLIRSTSDQALIPDRSVTGHCDAFAADTPGAWQHPVLTFQENAARLTMPLHLLDTWGWLPHNAPTVITPDEFAAAKRELMNRLSKRLLVNTKPAEITRLHLTSAIPQEPHGLWTTQLEIHLQFETGDELHYRLFNPRVLRACVIAARSDQTCRVSWLSSYDAKFQRTAN